MKSALSLYAFVAALCCAVLTGCEEASDDAAAADGSGTEEPGADAPGATDDVPGADGSGGEPGVGEDPTDDLEPPSEAPPMADAAVGRCDYTNPFSQSNECKAYTGEGWTADGAAADCAEVLGGPGTFVPDLMCAFDAELGRCAIGDPAADGYILALSGDDPADCALGRTACETFAGGVFEPTPTCADTDAPPPPPPGSGSPFVQPTLTCTPPREGEPAGQSEDGTVCTWNAISGCTEAGRKYDDYGSCEIVLTQRPYYPAPRAVDTAPDDPRFEDDEYLRELDWVKSEVESCACVCCHTERAAPAGASVWYTDTSEGLWIDTVPDTGLAMMAGLADSTALGAYAAADNNGFDRDVVGQPTTDVERMRAFFEGELERRGRTRAWAEGLDPFGGPLVEQLEHEPEPCGEGQGVDASGRLVWTGGAARYLYVMEADSKNPVTPPNLDLPDGTLWRIDAPSDGAAFEAPIEYGQVPDGISQRFPEGDDAPALVPGETYYLYVLLDIAIPVTRCLFEAPR